MTYTGQAPAFNAAEATEFLQSHYTARLCTHNRDGSIHAVPVGYLYRDGRFVIASYAQSRKRRNIDRDPDVTVLVDVEEPFQGIIVYGSASVETDRVLERMTDLMESMGTRSQGEAFSRAYLEIVDWVILTVTPRRMISFDYSKDDAFNRLMAEHFG